MRYSFRAIWRLCFSLLLLVLSSCNGGVPASLTPSLPASPQPSATATQILPTPQVRTTRLPEPEEPALAFLNAWKASDFAAMYALLDKTSQQNLSLDDLISRYQQVSNAIAFKGMDFQLLDMTFTNKQADVQYQVTLSSNLFGDLNAETSMRLNLEDGRWRIAWDPAMILPQLADGRYLSLDARMRERGDIFDRLGNPIVSYQDATAVGFYPDSIDPEQEETLVNTLARLAGLNPLNILGLYQDAPLGTLGYLPITEVADGEAGSLLNRLAGLSGIVLAPYSGRFYAKGGVAPHAVGYTSSIQQGDEEARYRQLGYLVSESVGRAGVEAWGESILAGPQQATLYQVAPDGTLENILAEASFGPSQSITTTLDSELQVGVQNAIRGLRAAVVVMERDTGRVLAIASAPGFDPNAYQTRNFNWYTQLTQMGQDPGQPTFNRATQGQYPLGSVFKIITISAALESGLFTPEDTIDCQYEFREVQGLVLYDWTYEHFLEDGETQPSGVLTLPQGLIRSCNPWFWKIGLDLYRAGKTQAVADMARGFGLGQATGIAGVEEQPGRIPEPNNEVDAVNQAIGQGDTLVTPLQVAAFVAAVGNGGTLYRPQMIEKIAPAQGEPTFVFQPDVKGTLPVSPENLSLIQQSMVSVIRSRNPLGTAYYVFTGLDLPLAGKTGTAQSGFADPHAWFAGYTSAGRSDKPDIAIAVLVEQGGEGSEVAAPIFRRVVELYFYGRPAKLYPWETTYGVTDTPTPYGFEEDTNQP